MGGLGFGEVFALNHEWKKLSDVDNTSAESATDSRKPDILGTLGIEITLVRKRAKSSPTRAYGWPFSLERLESETCHPKALLDAAFQSRAFTITIEKGNFSHDDKYDWTCFYSSQRWGFRLVFDKSPYPAPEAWDQSEPGLCRVELFGHRKVAVAKELPKSAADVKPMEDDTFVGSMIGDSRATARQSLQCAVS